MKLAGISAAVAAVSDILPRATTQNQPGNPPNVPAPYNFPPSQYFEGNDGQWSTFIIRVGTPVQTFRVLPATNGQETWVPLIRACVPNVTASCGDARGVSGFASKPHGGFESNRSSTWVKEGIFDLGAEANLGYRGNGLYGFDTVGLDIQGSGGPTLKDQTVAGFVTHDFYLGLLGLGPKPANFSDFNDPIPSLMRSLVDQRVIPTKSFGYTAGAHYTNSGVPGSLTLGGYDASRFTPNNITFNFDSDDSKSLTVALQEITVSNALTGTLNALSLGIISLIDSTIPAIWLPQKVCDQFEEALGLTYDNETEFYLVNDTIHEKLLQLKPTITFRISDTLADSNNVEIELPYAAFDLQAKYPYYNNTVNYFPIRRAANETQQVIGRTFLQEAYIIANYEEGYFQVTQAVSAEGKPSRIVPINNSTKGNENITLSTSIPHPHTISAGVIVGLAVGLTFVCASIIGLTVFFLRRRHIRRASEQSTRDNLSSSSTILGPGSPSTYKGGGLGDNSPLDFYSKQKPGSTSAEEQAQHPEWFKTELPSDTDAHPHKSLVWEDGELVRRKKPNQDGDDRRGIEQSTTQELGGCGPAAEMEDCQMQSLNTPSSGSTMVSPWQGRAFEPKEEIIYEMVGDEPRSPAAVVQSPGNREEHRGLRPPTGYF